MARTDDRLAGGGDGNPKYKPPKPKKVRIKKGRKKGTGKKGKKVKVKHAPKPGTWHEQSGAATAAGRTGSGASGLKSEAAKETGTMLHPAGKGMAPVELVADAEKGLGSSAAGQAGLGGVLLDLVGEGTIKLSGALAAWARESERITNRTWRRPGGLARMGGL